MKRLFLILSLVVSCLSCGDNELNYSEGSNHVVGTWNSYYEDTDSLLLIRVFTEDYYSYFSYANGIEQIELNKQRYSITDSLLILEKYTQHYKLNKDTLWITNSSQDQITTYIRNKNLSHPEMEY
ncbi:MAG: hypothetical protein E6772_02015 [Dysgonomonas sp.]|nr:hypothetical protein [Dysgonomonas sp.]